MNAFPKSFDYRPRLVSNVKQFKKLFFIKNYAELKTHLNRILIEF